VIEGLGARLVAHLDMIETARPGVEIVAVMDEPALVIFAPGRSPGPVPIEAAADAMSRLFSEAPIPIGIHVCGDTDWRMVAGLEPAWLSWDLAGLGDGFLSATDIIAEIVSQGTGIMWGMVPTDPTPIDLDRVRSRYGTAVTRLVLEGAPVGALTEHSFATPACGLAGTTVGGASVVMERLREAVEIVDG